jgi:hypothetical protein
MDIINQHAQYWELSLVGARFRLDCYHMLDDFFLYFNIIDTVLLLSQSFSLSYQRGRSYSYRKAHLCVYGIDRGNYYIVVMPIHQKYERKWKDLKSFTITMNFLN